MVVRKRKKVTKYRAKTTHGGGHRKKRRGAGSRGGRGNAGTGKRAGHKKAGIAPKLGKKGFLPRRTVTKTNTVNVGYFTLDRINKLIANNKASKEGETYTIDLHQLGYTKLLGTGSIKLKLKLLIKSYTAKAEQKVTAAGGMIEHKAAKKEETEQTQQVEQEQQTQ